MKKKNILFIITLIIINISQAQKNNKLNLSLDSCIIYAFENSSNLKANKQEILISGKDLEINKSKKYPVVNTYANYMVTDQYQSTGNIFFPNGISDNVVVNSGIEVIQPVWHNNKINLLVKQSKIGEQISQNVFKVEEFNLINNIRNQYVILLNMSYLEALSQKMADRIAVYVESAKERYKVGVARRSDVLKSETEYSNATVVVNSYKTRKNIAEYTLLKTMGADLGNQLQVNDFLKSIDSSYIHYEIDSFYQIALNNLPELKIAEQAISRQKLIMKLEGRSNGPELNVFARYSYNETPLPIQKDGWFSYAGITFNYRLFDGFRKKRRIAKETIKQEQLKLDIEDLQQLIYLEIQQSFLNLLDAKKQINNSLKQLENSSENLKIVKEEYEQGLSSMLELLDAENDDFIANQNYVNSLSSFHLARFELERKSGIYK